MKAGTEKGRLLGTDQLANTMLSMPRESAARVDGELIACDTDGKPDFTALMRSGDANLCMVFRPGGRRGDDMREKTVASRQPLEWPRTGIPRLAVPSRSKISASPPNV